MGDYDTPAKCVFVALCVAALYYVVIRHDQPAGQREGFGDPTKDAGASGDGKGTDGKGYTPDKDASTKAAQKMQASAAEPKNITASMVKMLGPSLCSDPGASKAANDLIDAQIAYMEAVILTAVLSTPVEKSTSKEGGTSPAETMSHSYAYLQALLYLKQKGVVKAFCDNALPAGGLSGGAGGGSAGGAF